MHGNYEVYRMTRKAYKTPDSWPSWLCSDHINKTVTVQDNGKEVVIVRDGSWYKRDVMPVFVPWNYFIIKFRDSDNLKVYSNLMNVSRETIK